MANFVIPNHIKEACAGRTSEEINDAAGSVACAATEILHAIKSLGGRSEIFEGVTEALDQRFTELSAMADQVRSGEK